MFTTYKPGITYLILTIVNSRSVREAKDSLFQSTITTASNQLGHDTDTEMRLSSVTRTILAQLSSWWSNSLNSYRARIIPGTSGSCRSCNQAPHDTVHIFNCAEKPTALQPIDPSLNSGLPQTTNFMTSNSVHTQLQRIIIILNPSHLNRIYRHQLYFINEFLYFTYRE